MPAQAEADIVIRIIFDPKATEIERTSCYKIDLQAGIEAVESDTVYNRVATAKRIWKRVEEVNQ